MNPLSPPTKPLATVCYSTIPVTPSLGSHLTIEFIKHVLFMRQQIPCTFSELEKTVNNALLAEQLELGQQQQEQLLEGSTTTAIATTTTTTTNHPHNRRQKKRKRLTAGFYKKMFKSYDGFQTLFQSIRILFQKRQRWS